MKGHICMYQHYLFLPTKLPITNQPTICYQTNDPPVHALFSALGRVVVAVPRLLALVRGVVEGQALLPCSRACRGRQRDKREEGE